MITSFIDGRVRIRTEALRNPATMGMVESVIRSREGVRSVQTNPRTGGMLVEYDPQVISRADLLQAAKALEEQLKPAGTEKQSGPKGRGRGKASGRRKPLGGKHSDGRENPSEVCVPLGRFASRRTENLLLGGLYVATVAGGLLNRRAHVAFGLLFTVLVGAHIFARRRCL